jgi:hypothetical protein
MNQLKKSVKQVVACLLYSVIVSNQRTMKFGNYVIILQGQDTLEAVIRK